MVRLTKWDAVRGCYIIVPDSTGNHIQKLGRLEDRDEAKALNMDTEFGAECPVCGQTEEDKFEFCPNCGQRLKWGEVTE